MKTLFLLRHAKSSWDDPTQRDYDRPLNSRGRDAAAAIGRFFSAENFAPDVVLSSPSVRTRETLKIVREQHPTLATPRFDDRIYLASLDTLLEVVHAFDASNKKALIVGHNPGLEDLALYLAGHGDTKLRESVAEKLPTGAFLELSIDSDSWSQFTRGAAALNRFVKPRQLDQTLDDD
jgi:phosphohistidine phosphatase